jgi:hypothetical protein
MNGLPLAIGIIEVLALFAVFFRQEARNWGGETTKDNDCLAHKPDTCFCESVKTPGHFNIKQPSNTWSNLGFVFVGLMIMSMLASSSSQIPQNPMQDVNYYSVFFGVLVIFLGPGSMYFHASLKKWGGWLDTLSMNLFMSFILVYTFVRLIGTDESSSFLVFLGLFLVINIVGGRLSWKEDHNGTEVFKILTGTTLVVEVMIFISSYIPELGSLRVHRQLEYLIIIGLCFAPTYYIWSRSETGGHLCKDGHWFGWFSPTSWMQGHAVWHIGNAIIAFVIFLYLRSEVIH